MAKFYYTATGLETIFLGAPYLQNGETHAKPSGTMGSHRLAIGRDEDGIYAVGVASNGTRSKKFHPKGGEKVGYDKGEVWLVPDPATIKDPLRRACLELKIRREAVEWVKDIQEALESFEGGVEYTCLGEGFYTFARGTGVYKTSDCGRMFVTKTHRVTGGINQSGTLSGVFVQAGTPRHAVADFIRSVWE